MTILAESRTKANRKSGKAGAAPKMTVSLCLAIDHQAYTVTPIRAEDPDVTRAWRLEKKGADGAVYDVATTPHGHQCDCPDWETRRNGLDPAGCKHIRACVVAGLLDAAPVIPAPPAVEPATPRPEDAQKAKDREDEERCRAFVNTSPYLRQTVISREKARSILVAVGKEDAFDPDDDYRIAWLPNDREVLRTPCRGILAENGSGLTWEAPDSPAKPAPAPCCPPGEPTACQPCQATAPATDAATAILDRGIALAVAEVNQPAPIVDTYPDEAPELDVEPTDEDRLAVAEWVTAADVQNVLDRSGDLPLAEAIDHIGNAFKAWDNPFGSMLAHVLEELAAKAFAVGATTPHELLTGIESLDREARETWERTGFERGRQSVAKPLTNIDDLAVRRGRPQRLNAFGSQPYRRPTT